MSETGAGGAAPPPEIAAVNGEAPPRPLTPEQEAEGAAVLAADARRAAEDARAHVDFTRQHAQGLIEGAEQAAADAEAAAAAADENAKRAAAAAGQES